MSNLDALASEQFCYLTTRGRRTGNDHTIEIWFAKNPERRIIYMLAGGGERSDWVRNIQQSEAVTVKIGGTTFKGWGRLVNEPEEEVLARSLVVAKYYGRSQVRATGWEAEALPVAIDLETQG